MEKYWYLPWRLITKKRCGREKKRSSQSRKGWLGLTSKVEVAITDRERVISTFMATNFHFNREFPSLSLSPPFPPFFSLPFRSFSLPLSYSGFNPFLGRWKKKGEKKKKRRGIMGPRLNARADYPVISQDFQKFLSPLSPCIHCLDGKTLLGPWKLTDLLA